jgi:hypothetical protein
MAMPHAITIGDEHVLSGGAAKIISIGPVENVHHHHGQKAKEQLLV